MTDDDDDEGSLWQLQTIIKFGIWYSKEFAVSTNSELQVQIVTLQWKFMHHNGVFARQFPNFSRFYGVKYFISLN